MKTLSIQTMFRQVLCKINSLLMSKPYLLKIKLSKKFKSHQYQMNHNRIINNSSSRLPIVKYNQLKMMMTSLDNSKKLCQSVQPLKNHLFMNHSQPLRNRMQWRWTRARCRMVATWTRSRESYSSSWTVCQTILFCWRWLLLNYEILFFLFD